MAEKTPCAVMQYTRNILNMHDGTLAVSELIYIDKQGRYKTKEMSHQELIEFEKEKYKFSLVLRSDDGQVYEYKRFKSHKEKLGVLHFTKCENNQRTYL
jgi:hypothetical protein